MYLINVETIGYFVETGKYSVHKIYHIHNALSGAHVSYLAEHYGDHFEGLNESKRNC